MIEKFNNIFSLSGLILLLVFILLFFLVGIVIKKRAKLNRAIRAPRIMRFLILPTAFIYILCVQIIDLSRTFVAIKVLETALVIFIITFLVNMASHLLFSDDNIITRKEVIPKLLRDIILFFLVTVASAFVFSSVWGFDLGSLLAALGVSSFVIGLALQEPLGNLFNGVSLLMEKPFQKGDWIQIEEDYGKVVEFNGNSVKLITLSNELIIIPNNKFGKEQIKNLSRPNKIHAELVTIGFSYNDDPIKVKGVLLEIANRTEGILQSPKPIPLTMSYDDFYIKYGLKFYIKDFQDLLIIRDRLMTEMYSAARKNELTIPFPIRDVIIRDPLTNSKITTQ